MLGDSVSAPRALEFGIVHQVVPDDSLLEAARTLAARLANGPRSIGLIKRALEPSLGNDLNAQLTVEENTQTEAVGTADFLEGVTAFLQKRTPHFTGQ